jgi:hypothetical protein
VATLNQLACWILMIVGEAMLASDSYVLATENDAYTFTAVGMVPVLSAGLLLYFVYVKTTETV